MFVPVKNMETWNGCAAGCDLLGRGPEVRECVRCGQQRDG
jgi:hypothetical protein